MFSVSAHEHTAVEVSGFEPFIIGVNSRVLWDMEAQHSFIV